MSQLQQGEGGGSDRIQTFPKLDFPIRQGGGGGSKVWDMFPNSQIFFFEVTPNTLYDWHIVWLAHFVQSFFWDQSPCGSETTFTKALM